MAASSSSSLNLGRHAVLELRAAPVLLLVPKRPGAVIKTYEDRSFQLAGDHKNVPDKLPCRLEWQVESDSLPTHTCVHPRQTMIVVSGAGYEIKESVDGQAGSLVFSAFELGVAGKGRIGYSIRPEFLGDPVLDVKPEDSGITFELPAAMNVVRADPNLPEETPFRAGTELLLVPDFGDGFRDCRFRVTVYETADDGTKIPGTEQRGPTLEWTRGAPATAKTCWCVGAEIRGDNASRFNYAPVASRDGLHRFVYEVEIEAPVRGQSAAAQPGSDATAPRGQTLVLPPRPLGSMLRPSLRDFQLHWTTDESSFVVEGGFDGFDKGYIFSMEVELFTFSPDAPDMPRIPGSVSKPFSKASSAPGEPGRRHACGAR